MKGVFVKCHTLLRCNKILIIAYALFMIESTLSWLILQNTDLLMGKEYEIVPSILKLSLGWNSGINFGLLSEGSDTLKSVLIGIGVIFVIYLLYTSSKSENTLKHIAVALIIGGACGNISSRIINDAVADYINLTCCGIINPYIFNIADVYIFLGCVTIVLCDSEKGEHSHRRT